MYLEAQMLTLFCGISLVNGFFHFRHSDFMLKDEQQSSNKSIFQNDSTYWIEQQVDHFNNTDRRTWRQKYYKEMHSWEPEGPIILYLGGEQGITEDKLDKMYWHDYGTELQSLTGQIAVETGAAIFMLEHRYYGESQPFDKSTVKDLDLLHSRQALADAAHLLRTIKQTPGFQKSKVIVVGGSYAGNLAAWMRLMYPELVDTALASSAPVLAKKDFYEYLEAVTDTFRTYGSQECVDEITERFNSTHVYFHNSEEVRKVIGEEYTCEDLDMMVLYISTAQYGTPKDISTICRVVIKCSQYNMTSEPDILSSVSLKSDTFSSDFRSWLFQLCTEFGYFSTTSNKQMFEHRSSADVYKTCADSFGEEFNEERIDKGVINTNRMYGGLILNVTNVVFVNGDMDPWHRLGVVEDLSADAPAIFIRGSSHCRDLNTDPNDTDNIKEARKRIKTLLKEWIGQA